jgi:hypothetical protein
MWTLSRVNGGYRCAFSERSEAVARGREICRQLPPSRLIVRDAAGQVVQEVAFQPPTRRLVSMPGRQVLNR